MKRKLFIPIMILTLVITSLSSCTGKVKEEDMGRINSVEVGQAAKEEPLFEEQECPFSGYSLSNLDYYSANMSLKIPSHWSAAVQNPTLIKISVPIDDPHFPGNTFYIQSIFDFSVAEDGLSETNSDVTKLYQPFKTSIEGLKYSIAGSKEGSLRRWRGAWDKIEAPSFVKVDNLAATATIADEILYDKKTSEIVAQNVGYVATFFKWQDFPVMISTFALRGEMEDAVKMTEYMMSTATFKKPKIGNTEDKQFSKKVSANLPVEFEASPEIPNVFRSPVNKTLSTSGISIGVYEVPATFADKSVDANSLMQKAGQIYPLELMDPTCAGIYTPSINVTGEAEKSIIGETRAFFVNCNMITAQEPTVAAYRTYGPASLLYMNCYVVTKEEKNYLVISMFPRHQSELSYAIERLVIKTLKV